MTNEYRDKLAALLKWAAEDEEERSLLIVADDEDGTIYSCYGHKTNLISALVAFMIKDEAGQRLIEDALITLEKYTQDNDKAKTNND